MMLSSKMNLDGDSILDLMTELCYSIWAPVQIRACDECLLYTNKIYITKHSDAVYRCCDRCVPNTLFDEVRFYTRYIRLGNGVVVYECEDFNIAAFKLTASLPNIYDSDTYKPLDVECILKQFTLTKL